MQNESSCIGQFSSVFFQMIKDLSLFCLTFIPMIWMMKLGNKQKKLSSLFKTKWMTWTISFTIVIEILRKGVSYVCDITYQQCPAPSVTFWYFFSKRRESIEIFKWKSSYDRYTNRCLRGKKMVYVWSTAGIIKNGYRLLFLAFKLLVQKCFSPTV